MTYTQINMAGKQICDYLTATRDSLGIENKTYEYEPEWSASTDFLCTFDNNLNAGNAESGVPNPDKISIYRRKTGEPYIRKVGTVGFNTVQFRDFNVSNDSEYYYQLYAEAPDIQAVIPFKTSTVKTYWDSYSLLSGIEQKTPIKDANGEIIEYEKQFIVEDIYLFSLDSNVSNLNANIGATMVSNFTRYPKFHKSQQNFYSGTLTGLLGYENTDGQYYDSVELLEKLRNAMTDGKKKYLKDLRGHLWEVELTSFTTSSRSQFIENPYDIQIGFTEVASANNVIMKG